jgi:vacuolar-type H+-ATPase subunit I/STV1
MADEEKNKGTAVTGSEPVKDTAAAGAEPAKDQAGKPPQPAGDDKLPFDQHPKWKSARQAEKQLDEMKEAVGAGSVEDLRDLVEAGKKIRGVNVDLDKLDEIIAKAAKLEEYEEIWKTQQESKRREEEAPEDTVRRLEEENKKLRTQEDQKRKAQQQEAEGKKLWENYDRTCTREVDSMDLPKTDRDAVLLFLGVNSDASNVDFRKPEEIRKVVKSMGKTWDSLKQKIIDDYIASKDKIPKVPSGAASDQGAAPIKNLKEARTRFAEMANRTPK